MTHIDTHATDQESETPSQAKPERLVMTSVRLDPTLHQALRQIAFNRHKSLHSLLIEGARSVCQRYQQDAVQSHAAE